MKNRKLFAIITLVAFMLTMMPVMAFAADPTSYNTYVDFEKTSATAAVNGESAGRALELDIYLNAALTEKQKVVVVAERNGAISYSDYLKTEEFGGNTTWDTEISGITNPGFVVLGSSAFGSSNAATVYAKSNVAGNVTLKVYIVEGADAPALTNKFEVANAIAGKTKNVVAYLIDSQACTIGDNVSTEVITVQGVKYYKADGTKGDVAEIAGEFTDANVTANSGASYYEVTVAVTKNNAPVEGATVALAADKVGVNFNVASVETNRRGQATYRVYATASGPYTVSMTSGDAEAVEKTFTFGGLGISAGSFTFVTDKVLATGINAKKVAVVKCTDANGNNASYDNDVIKVQVIEAPATSTYYKNVTSANAVATGAVAGFSVVKDAGVSNQGYVSFTPDVPGVYTLKVLNTTTGVGETVSFTAAKFGTVDHIVASYDFDSYALGATTSAITVKAVDTAGVEKEVDGSAISYAGVGVAKFNQDGKGTIEFLSNAAYAGQKIVVTAVYDKKFMASTTLTIGVKPASINFTEATGKAGATTVVKGQLVDLNGNAVALASDAAGASTIIVVAKPEGALASATAVTTDFGTTGAYNLRVTSNKEGIVKVNVIVPVDEAVTNFDAADYYVAGTATVNFGGVAVVETPAESIVNMIIGANTVIADGKASASPVAPFIENGRTFVPVRAFAEATGATVNYDAATQVITIKATGVDAQMTVGSNVMTVNGETVVMDAAAQVIGEGYTVLPVRYAGQALGYSFDVAYGANGAVTAVTMTK